MPGVSSNRLASCHQRQRPDGNALYKAAQPGGLRAVHRVGHQSPRDRSAPATPLTAAQLCDHPKVQDVNRGRHQGTFGGINDERFGISRSERSREANLPESGDSARRVTPP